MLRYLLSHWSTAFALTLAVEVPLFVGSTRGVVPAARAALAGALGSCITHPLLWFAWRHLVPDPLWFVLSGEPLVAAVESLVFFAAARPVGLWRAVGASCIANGASYGVGLLLSACV